MSANAGHGPERLRSWVYPVQKQFQRPRARWCVQWLTTAMAASAFWYYETEADALEARKALHSAKAAMPS